MSQLNHHEAERIARELKLSDIAETGYYFCKSCQRITEKVDSPAGGQQVCIICGSAAVKFCDPVFRK